MQTFKRIRYLVTALCLALPLAAGAATTASEVRAPGPWLTIDDGDIQVHYQQKNEATARRIAGVYRVYMSIMEKVFDQKLNDTLHLAILDQYDFSNGYSTFTPHNINGIYIKPPTKGELLGKEPWIDAVVRHEATHLYQFDTVSGAPANLQKIFGRNFLLFPSFFMPSWILEGLAVYQETDQVLGYGRGSSGYYDAIMRMELQRGWRGLANTSYNNYGLPYGVAYYYGYYFFEFLYKRSGDKKIWDFVADYNNNLVPFRLDDTITRHYGVDFWQLWDEYKIYLDKKFGGQRQEIASTGLIQGKSLARPSYVWPQPGYDRQGRLHYIYTNNYTGTTSLIRRDSQPDKGGKLRETTLAAGNFGSYDVHSKGALAYTTLAVCKIKHNWSQAKYYDLYVKTSDKAKPQKIAPCRRYIQVRWHPNGRHLFALRYAGGQSQLDLLSTTGELIDHLYQGQPGEVLGSFSVSRDASALAFARQTGNQGWNIALFHPDSKSWTRLTKGDSIDTDPAFSQGGAGLLYSSNRGGVFNIWRYDLASGQSISLSNVMTGAFEPTPGPDNSLVFSLLHSDGYTMQTIPFEPHPTVELKRAENPVAHRRANPADFQPPRGRPGPYSIFTGFAPTSWLPLLLGDGYSETLGVLVGGSDVLYNHGYQLFAGFTQWAHYNRTRFIYDGSYAYHNWLQLNTSSQDKLESNKDDLLVGINTNSAQVNIDLLSNIDRQLQAFGAVLNQEKVYWAENNNNDRPDEHKKLGAVGLDYSSLGYGVKSVVPGKGMYVRLMAERSYQRIGSSAKDGNVYQGFFSQFIHLGGGHVLAGELARGYADKYQDRFHFGSIAGASLPQPGERYFPMPGYASGETYLTGRGYSYAEISWTLPDWTEGFGFLTPPVGVSGGSYIRVFSDYLSMQHAASADPNDREFTNIGVEVNFNVVLGLVFTIPLKIMVAQGLSKDGETQAGVGASYFF